MKGDVLVTGASGFVGGHMVRALRDAGYRVCGLDRKDGSQEVCSEFARCDLTDDASVSEASFSREFDAIVHLAGALPGQTTRGGLFALNAGATSAMLHHFAHPGCHVVLFSTGLVYGGQAGPFVEDMECRPEEPYAQSKWAAEQLVRSFGHIHGARTTVLRPSVLYGDGAPEGMLISSLLKTLRAGQPAPMTQGAQLRDFLHVEDAVRAVALVLERRPVGTFNLGAGESQRVRDVAELAGRISGRSHLLQVGVLPYRKGEVFDYRLDTRALGEAVGFAPRYRLEDGLKATFEALS